MFTVEVVPAGGVIFQAEIEALKSAWDSSPFGGSLPELCTRVVSGQSSLFRLKSARCNVLVEVQVCTYPKGKELHIVALAGWGLRRALDAVVLWADDLAVRHGCRWVGMESHRPGWARVLKRVARQVATTWVREVNEIRA